MTQNTVPSISNSREPLQKKDDQPEDSTHIPQPRPICPISRHLRLHQTPSILNGENLLRFLNSKTNKINNSPIQSQSDRHDKSNTTSRQNLFYQAMPADMTKTKLENHQTKLKKWVSDPCLSESQVAYEDTPLKRSESNECQHSSVLIEKLKNTGSCQEDSKENTQLERSESNECQQSAILLEKLKNTASCQEDLKEDNSSRNNDRFSPVHHSESQKLDTSLPENGSDRKKGKSKRFGISVRKLRKKWHKKHSRKFIMKHKKMKENIELVSEEQESFTKSEPIPKERKGYLFKAAAIEVFPEDQTSEPQEEAKQSINL